MLFYQNKKEGLLSGVPKNLPVLIKTNRVQEKVASIGFDFPNVQNVIEKIVSIINPQKNDYIVEIGPGKVLSGLIKRIDKNQSITNVNGINDIKNLNIND